MKIKQQLYITEPDKFLSGDYHSCFNLFGDDEPRPCEGWIACGEIWIDVDVDTGEVRQQAIDALECAEKALQAEYTAKLNQIAAKKQELLAIEYREAV